MYRILLISRFTQEGLSLKTTLELNTEYSVEWVRTPQQATQALAKQLPDMAIINVDHFNQQKQLMALQMRQMGFNFPILYLCNSGARLFAKLSRRLGNTALLEKPANIHEMNGVIDKLRKGKKISPRAYRRYHTDQVADVEYWNTGRKINGQILNLSLGGAQLKIKDSSIRVGDVLKLNVELTEMAKHHEVNAKVVWSGNYDPLTQTNQVGVQFVKTVEIYKNLLNRI
ncbi:MAG: PilZ domain-containing protein [Bdellovibrionia bacterium]